MYRIFEYYFEAFCFLVSPTPFKSRPKLVAYSAEVLEEILDLDSVVTSSPEFIDWVSGNTVLPGSRPLAHRYGGHQVRYHNFNNFKIFRHLINYRYIFLNLFF
jgi:uncharacterized protein YdiU (UPF0061 family)